MGMLDAAALGDSVLSRVAGLLLAAGPGRRIGGPKALLRQGDTLLVERALAVLRESTVPDRIAAPDPRCKGRAARR